MRLGSFYIQMCQLVAELAPTIGAEYRAEGCDGPSMGLTIGANARGWTYQTGDNSFSGSAYSYRDWAVTTLEPDSNAFEVADDIVSQCKDFETDIFEVFKKPDSEALEALRTLARGRVHGGYAWAAVLSDGECLCESCVRSEYRAVFKATRDRDTSGWAVQGITHSGESESDEHCCNCSAAIWTKE
jgi:hypothetical protein